MTSDGTRPGYTSPSGDFKPKRMRPDSRTCDLVRSAKKKHRTDIPAEAWSRQGYYKIWNKAKKSIINACNDVDIDTVRRVTYKASAKGQRDGDVVDLKEFVRRFEQPNGKGKPCVVKGLCDEWPASTKWSLSSLRERFGNELLKCGEDDDGNTIKMKLKHFFRYMASHDEDGARRDDSPLYIFDSNLERNKNLSKLLAEYTVPPLFSEDLFRHVGEARRPPYRWFLIGPERSGSTVHIDPLGTSAWNSLISGRKLWAVFPPRCPRSLSRQISV